MKDIVTSTYMGGGVHIPGMGQGGEAEVYAPLIRIPSIMKQEVFTASKIMQVSIKLSQAITSSRTSTSSGAAGPSREAGKNVSSPSGLKDLLEALKAWEGIIHVAASKLEF